MRTVARPKPLGLLRPTPTALPPMRVPENIVGRGAGRYFGGATERGTEGACPAEYDAKPGYRLAYAG